MKTKQRRAFNKKAAGYVADLILDSLESVAESERRTRLKRVYAALRASSGKQSKRFPIAGGF